MRNVHERLFPGVEAQQLAELVATLGSVDDRLWPHSSKRWPPMRMSGPLADLPRGGHGFVRYEVIDHSPGHSTTFRFDDKLGLHGIHRFDVVRDGSMLALRHVIEARTTGSMRLAWPLAVRWLHDALIEEAFDGVEVRLGIRDEVRRPSPWVRLLLAILPSAAREDARACTQG